MYDVQSGMRWIQYQGAPLEGPDIGTRLPEIPSINTTLGAWLDAYPESDVVSDRIAPTQDLFDNYYAGGRAGMLVLQEAVGDWTPLHFAFTTSEADIDRSAAELRERGVEVTGPVTHDWMPARSIYFNDPDGHDLELCAPLGKS